jgi:MFS family permease
MVRSAPLGRTFSWLLTASGLSNLADGLLKVVVPLLAVQVTSSPTLVAVVAASFRLPWLVTAIPAGVLVDRMDRRRAMVVANLARALAVGMLCLGWAAGLESVLVLVVMALMAGVAETVYDSAAPALLPMIVRRDELTRANGRLFAVELTANEFIGPPLGGFLIAAGAVLSLATPVAAWLVAVGLLLLGVRGSFRADQCAQASSSWYREALVGLRYLWRHDVLRVLAFVVGTFNFCSQAVYATLVLYVVGPGSAMGLDGTAYGLLLAAGAAGNVVGFLFVAERVEHRWGRARVIAVAIVVAGLALTAPGATTNPWIIGGAVFVGGAASAVWNVITVSLRQRIIPLHLLGRVSSGFRLLAWGTGPLGAVAGGLAAETVGLRPVFAAAGALAALLVVPVHRLSDRQLDGAERENGPAS